MKGLKELLVNGLDTLGIRTDEEMVFRLLAYLEELRKWNKAHNLTAIRDDREIIEKHFLDSSLYIVKGLPPGFSTQEFWAGKKVLDVGSGAGFPGLVMKILEPRISMWLMEPSGKKAAFLRHMIRMLGLQAVEVIEASSKDYRPGESGPLFDVVVTRALFKAGEFIRQCRGFTGTGSATGGYMVMSKGPGYVEELNGIVPAPEVIPATLPFSGAKRFFLIFRA